MKKIINDEIHGRHSKSINRPNIDIIYMIMHMKYLCTASGR